jgi:hypothetical protein
MIALFVSTLASTVLSNIAWQTVSADRLHLFYKANIIPLLLNTEDFSSLPSNGKAGKDGWLVSFFKLLLQTRNILPVTSIWMKNTITQFKVGEAFYHAKNFMLMKFYFFEQFGWLSCHLPYCRQPVSEFSRCLCVDRYYHFITGHGLYMMERYFYRELFRDVLRYNR